MTARTFFAADLHLGHSKVVGTRGFACEEEHDRAIIERWNQTVTPKDRVYVLGDLVMNRRCLEQLKALNGKLEPVLGNHDTWRLDEYAALGIKRVHGAKEWKGLILTHVPVHSSQLRRFRGNVHGHLHEKVVHRARKKQQTGGVVWNGQEQDPRYLCVSLERTDLRPIDAESVLAHFDGIKTTTGSGAAR